MIESFLERRVRRMFCHRVAVAVVLVIAACLFLGLVLGGCAGENAVTNSVCPPDGTAYRVSLLPVNSDGCDPLQAFLVTRETPCVVRRTGEHTCVIGDECFAVAPGVGYTLLYGRFVDGGVRGTARVTEGTCSRYYELELVTP